MSDFFGAEIQNFLDRAGWNGAAVEPLAGDASTRRYARVRKGGDRLMLMHQPQGAETATAPADASPAQRQALGYNAIARLAGADTGRFAAVADYLRGRGLAAPKIHAADFSQGLLLIEDFGDALFADVLNDGRSEEELYRHAVEVLAKLHAENSPAQIGAYPLFDYDELALLAETDLLTEWFMPLALGRPVSSEERAAHRALWKDALDGLARAPSVFVHRDYHAQNLIWMPNRTGLEKVGLIDFQDAVAGPRTYDLVSLLEDARRDVAPDLAARATAHYLAAMRAQGTPLDEEAFGAEMAVMAAQRNAKIVGIFARLYKRDGKARYLSYLPRVWRMLEADLRHPSLAALSAWYDRAIPPAARTLPELQKDLA